MLNEFLATYREAIIAKTKDKLLVRTWPAVTAHELESGVPLFLNQLAETLRWEATTTPFSPTAIGTSAARHGEALQTLGFSLSQVVHDYGDICQAITEVAMEHDVPITTEEFHTLNRCLDTAIAEAVTEHARLTTAARVVDEVERARRVAAARTTDEVERLGGVVHEVRDSLNTALLAFHTLKRGTVAINGSTGAVLGRSLMRLRDYVDNTLADVRLSGNHQRRERVSVASFLNDIAAAGGLSAEYRQLRFIMEPIEPGLSIEVDPQLLSSAVTNLLNNAFKFTPAGGCVTLRAQAEGDRLRIEVEDECGGLPQSEEELFKPFADRRGADRSGLGLGLSMARKAVNTHNGEVTVHNMPGKGCVFVIDVPLAGEEARSPAEAI
jgi:signal transduction histidine kinase